MPLTFRYLNAIGLLIINVILLFAFYDQFANSELPCPLCLLQRVAFVAIMFGVLLNIQYGPKPSHYGFIMIAVLFGMMVALRQISLHVIPGTPAYGDAILGLHYYTWAFVCFFLVGFGVSVVILFNGQFSPYTTPVSFKSLPLWVRVIIISALLIIIANAFSAFFECGPGTCKDNPKAYFLLEKWFK